MAQMVLTVVGQYFFGPIGGAVGSFIGGAIDRALAPDPADQVGPRLDELKVTTSTYGVNIPHHFGVTRTAGNIIYAQDLHEVQNVTETDVGGKGGPTQTTITYSYFATFAVSAGHGVGRGVRRMWANGALVWDVSVGATNPAAVALDFTFYPGTPDQMPDPTMEADLGVGMVPAYRDEIIVVFHEVPLEKFGNRLPSFEFELIMDDGEWGAADQTVLNEPSADPYRLAVQAIDGSIVAISEVDSSNVGLARFDVVTGETLATSTYAMGLNTGTHAVYVPPTNEVWVPISGIDAGYERFSAETLAHVGSVAALDGLNHAGGAFYDYANQKVFGLSGLSLFFGYDWVTYGLDGVIEREYDTTDPAHPVLIPLDRVTACDYMIGGGAVVSLGWVAAMLFCVFDISPDAPTRQLGRWFTDARAGVFDPTRNRYVAIGGDSVFTVDDSLTPNPTEITPVGYDPGIVTGARYAGGLDVIEVFGSWITSQKVTVLDAQTFEVLHQQLFGPTSSYYAGPGVFSSQHVHPGTVVGIGSTAPWSISLYRTTYASAVRTLCLISGVLDEADIDVTELDQTLYGYAVAQAGPVRSAIEQLARTDLFDGVEVDDKLKFPRRGGPVLSTIALGDCGAGIDGPEQYAASTTRVQELDLPANLFITASDPFTDYQPGTQYAQRLAHHAGDDETESYAVVMTATTAKQLADARMYDRWASRETGKISTMRKHALLSPCDPITFDDRRVRITARSDEGGLIRFDWITDDPEVVVQLSIGAQGKFPGQLVPVQVPTTLIVLDIPLLRDADNAPGAYVAAWGLEPYWRGMSLFMSDDGGLSYQALLTLAAPGSSVGVAVNALGDWTGGNVFDEGNSLTVSMRRGAPSGTTRAGVLSGSNGLAIEGADGWEIIQYRDVVLNGDGSYTLSGFLRGRRGTEWAMAGHAIGNRVVLLVAGAVRNMPLDAADLGVSRLYKPVTVGATLSGTTAQAETVEGERLKPFSPVDLRALRDVVTGDITITWRRRTRLSYRFLAPGIAPPLGESSEAYVVTVWDDNTYTTSVRTIAATAETATYSSADQVTDFGSNQSTVYVTVTQTSAAVGAGHELRDAA